MADSADNYLNTLEMAEELGVLDDDDRAAIAALRQRPRDVAAEFDESLHPRDERGRFTETDEAGVAHDGPAPEAAALHAVEDWATGRFSHPRALAAVLGLSRLIPVPGARVETIVERTAFGQRLEIEQTITHAGRVLAHTRRTLAADTKTIDLEYLAIDPQFRGQGIGGAYHRELERAAKAAGFTALTMVAASATHNRMIGAYVWAKRAGWDFANERHRAAVRARFLTWARARTSTADDPASYRVSEQDVPETLTPQQLAAFTVGGKRIGREFLLGNTEWEGVKRL